MSQSKRRLGRALSDMGVAALLSETEQDLNNEQIQLLRLDQVTPNVNQPRKTFQQEPLEELAASIKAHGILQPIIVTRKNNGYEIIAGERRFRAAKMAGLNDIPTIIKNLD